MGGGGVGGGGRGEGGRGSVKSIFFSISRNIEKHQVLMVKFVIFQCKNIYKLRKNIIKLHLPYLLYFVI